MGDRISPMPLGGDSTTMVAGSPAELVFAPLPSPAGLGLEEAAVALSAPLPMPALGLDDATLALERLVEETHRALVRDGLIQDSLCPHCANKYMDDSNFCRKCGKPRLSESAPPPPAAAAAPCSSSSSQPPHAPPPLGKAIPSLDAVDQALEELQRGLAEIDSALARGGADAAASSTWPPAAASSRCGAAAAGTAPGVATVGAGLAAAEAGNAPKNTPGGGF